MGNCVNLASIEPAANCVDVDNRSGIVNRIIVGYADEVETWPDLPAPASSSSMTMEQAGKWSGELAMKTGCKCVEINITDETGVITITEQGDKGAESFLFDLTVVRAKINAAIAGFENAVKGRPLVILAQDRNGIKYLMGDKLVPAYKVAGDGSTTGTTGTDRNQTSLKFQYACPRKLVYDGELDSLLAAVPGV